MQACFTSPDTCYAGEHLSFDAGNTYLPGWNITEYYWNFDDGSSADTQQVTHTFQQEGSYIVELTVTDNQGNVAKNSSKIILLFQSPPDPPIIHQAPSFVNTGETFQLVVQTTDLEFDQVQYGIKWDQDSSIEWNDEWYNVNETCVFNHIYTMIGSHEIQVKARDVHYAESNWSVPLTITVEDNMDPDMVILSPRNGVYIKDVYRFPFFSPLIFGPITFEVNASDSSGIEKVMFYVDDDVHPKAEVLSPPYRYVYDEMSFSKHDIIIKVYDSSGRMSEEQRSIWKFL